MGKLLMVASIFAAAFMLQAAPVQPPLDVVYECDRLATHPDDPDRVARGLEREEMNLPVAEATCRKAVAEVPGSARANYHLARALYYQGKQAESLPYLEKSAAIGYRQAIFVLGYALTFGGDIPKDMCRAKELWRRGIGLDHPWSGFHLVDKQIGGGFNGCSDPVSKAEVQRAMKLAFEKITLEASVGRVEKLKTRADAYLAQAK